MQLTCSPVYSISLFTFNFSQPLPEPAYTWTTPDYRGLESRPRAFVLFSYSRYLFTFSEVYGHYGLVRRTAPFQTNKGGGLCIQISVLTFTYGVYENLLITCEYESA